MAHFSAGSLITSVVHSQDEHTIGVWKLAAILFPENWKLRAAAILYDTGHLPFSHAVEKPLGLDHHKITESIILSDPVRAILGNAHLSSEDLVLFLRGASPLTGTGSIMGIDHLDSFLRDT